MSASSGVGAILKICGGLLITFGIIDFSLYTFFAYDLTGFSWSPVAAGVAGSVLMRIGGGS
ncbi:MAG: hypothetical protein RLZZ436_4594 [Planctomycetota bacterium]|jgi:hypothetical protein